MRSTPVTFQAQSHQVIEVAIRKSLHIKSNQRALDPQFRTTDDVYFLFPDREGFQGVMILLGFGSALFNAAPRAESIGKLANGENTSTVKPFSFLIRQIGEQAQIVFLNGSVSATVLEFALGARGLSRCPRDVHI